jgi:chromosome partitioning protein
MPTIVMASPKGGAGKTTAALLLATTLAKRGGQVTLLDADRNKPLAKWAKRPGVPQNLTVIDDVNEQTIVDTIDRAAESTPFVIVDLEGTASLTVAYAISRADMVIIPTKASQLDAVEAVATIREVKRHEKAFRITIPAVVMITQTNPAIRSRGLASIEASFVKNGVSLLDTRLYEREAYRAIFAFGGTLESLDPHQVRNIDAAIDNAAAFADEVLRLLKRLVTARTVEIA